MPTYDVSGNLKIIDSTSLLQIRTSGSIVMDGPIFLDFSGSGIQSITPVSGGCNITIVAGQSGANGTNGVIQWVEGTPSPRLRTTASIAITSDTIFAEEKASDINFYVSGTITTGSSADNVSVFGGTAIISGNLILGSPPEANPTNSFIEFKSTGDVLMPPTNALRVYTRSRALRQTLEIVGPAGIDSPLQPAFFTNSIFLWSPSNSNLSGSVLGWVLTPSGTITHPTTTAPGNQLNTIRRSRFAGAAAARTGAGIWTSHEVCFRPKHVGQGGWFFFARFGIPLVPTGSRCFVGIGAVAPSTPSNTIVATDISTSTDFIGVGWDRVDDVSGTWKIMYRDTVLTIGKTNANNVIGRSPLFCSGSVMDVTIFCPTKFNPLSASYVGVRLVEHVSGVNGVTKNVLADNVQINSPLPTEDTELRVHAVVHNGLGTSATQFDLNRLYLETDY